MGIPKLLRPRLLFLRKDASGNSLAVPVVEASQSGASGGEPACPA